MTRIGALLLFLLTILFLAVGVIALPDSFSEANYLRVFIRLCALYGFLMMAIAAIMTPFLSTVYRLFGKPFLTVHHMFAISGTVLATLHPIAFAIQIMNPAVFLPRAQSWIDFWANAGRPALILLYIALAGALLRSKWKSWRYSHALMYVVLLFSIVHGNLIGSDFSDPVIRILYNGVFAAVVLTFFLSIWKKLKKQTKGTAADP